MPNVQELYQKLINDGYTAKDAAKEAQARTGHSVVTGRPIRHRGPEHKTKRKWVYGESDS